MDGTTPPPEYSDKLYETQASYLAEHTPLTNREAEAYLRRSHTCDDQYDKENYVANRELADQMGVSESGFSTHLNSAREKLETDASTRDALTTMLCVTDLGGVNGHSRYVIGSTTTRNAHILLTRNEFAVSESLASKYKAHLVYRDSDPAVSEAIDDGSLPGNTIVPTKFAVFTIDANSPTHLVESVAAYIDTLPALDEYDLISAANLLEDTLDIMVDDTTDYASKTVQDASATIMDREGQR